MCWKRNTRSTVYFLNILAARNLESGNLEIGDRGSQYVSNVWREGTKNIQGSYSYTSYLSDNAGIESFHSRNLREWL